MENKNANIKVNDILKVKIEDFSSSGTGVAFCDGYPLFISGAITDDFVTVRVTKTNKNYGFAKIIDFDKKSIYRVQPQCNEFEKCGGCDMMHINYDMQLKIKESFIRGNLHRIARLADDEYTFEGIIGAENMLNYRNKAQFPVSSDKNNRAICGFYSPKSHTIVPCTDCKIQKPEINKAVNIVVDFLNKNKISIYNEKTHTGTVRHIYVRYGGDADKSVMVVIVTNSKKPLSGYKELAEILSKGVNLTGLIQNINTKKGNLVLGSENITLYGNPAMIAQQPDLKFIISPNSFFQVNYDQMNKLYGKAVEYADLSGEETVFDLYCGVGSISLYLAQKAKNVVGIEIVEQAVENANQNAELNNIKNVEFFAGDCPRVVKKLIEQGYSADIVVVDPPRKGCDEELLKLIFEINPKKLIYVSCNSSTLARDILILKDYGFKLQKAVGVDMFPQSLHVECVVCMQRKDTL